ncbi:hypothetical protein CDL15_Pgr016819 [Punica granatum]|uniref:Uncharacterized protein n=1 Tax=Punica granatum TaxID=22663 RepID=A0A218WZC7_PUNGR|nr:hypothetical protein CDL15_Pgr016819 [Punica granatum]
MVTPLSLSSSPSNHFRHPQLHDTLFLFTSLHCCLPVNPRDCLLHRGLPPPLLLTCSSLHVSSVHRAVMLSLRASLAFPSHFTGRCSQLLLSRLLGAVHSYLELPRLLVVCCCRPHDPPSDPRAVLVLAACRGGLGQPASATVQEVLKALRASLVTCSGKV